jgi:cytochrome c-type biogenesis protein CcmH
MKREATDLLAAGYTGDQVLSYFERSYGEFIRLEPKPEGFNILVWIVPVAGLLLGLALIVMRVRGKAAPIEPEPTAGSEPELDAYRERVRREIER